MFQKLTISILTLLVSSVAIAAGEGLYRDLDINDDGAISREEAARLPGLDARWNELDTNADGKLDAAEFAKLEEVIDTTPK